MLSRVQKPSVKRKPNAAVAPRVIYKRKSSRIIPAVAQKASEMSTLVTLHSSPMCNKCPSRFVPQIYPTGRLLRSAMGVPERIPTGLKMDEIFNIPKKVNRHVLKAVRHFTEEEGYEFAPLHTIKFQAMWTMRNLIPVKDIETVIECSLQILTDFGVLSERDQTYRLDCGKPLAVATSLSIFGKVSASFLAPSPSQDMGDAFGAQNILYMEESEMPHVSASQSSTYRGGDTYFQADQASNNVGSLSSLSSQNSNTRPAEGVSGMENGSLLGLCGSFSYLPLVSSGSLSQERHSAIGVSQDQKSSTNFGEGESGFQNKQTSTPSEASADIASLSSLGSQNMSIRSTEGVFDMMNASMTGLCGSLSCEELPLESLSQECQNGTEANNISVMDLDEPMSKDSHVSVIQEMQAETMDMDIRPVEGVFGTELHGENASSVGPRDSPICVQIPPPFFYYEMDNATLFGPRGCTFCLQLPQVASGSSSQEMTNVFGANNISNTVLDEPMLADSHVSVIQAQQTSMSAEAINIDIRPDEEVLGTELDVENASSAGPRDSQICVQIPSPFLNQEMDNAHAEDSHDSVSIGAQSFQSIPNEAPGLLPIQVEQSATSSETQNAVSIHQEPHESPDEQ